MWLQLNRHVGDMRVARCSLWRANAARVENSPSAAAFPGFYPRPGIDQERGRAVTELGDAPILPQSKGR